MLPIGGETVSTETEVKLRMRDLDQFRQRLGCLGPEQISGRHFEDNQLFDFPDGRLRARYSVLRVRTVPGYSWLTFKGPPRPEGTFKVREELETALADGRIALRILEEIGMEAWFRYQKYREEFVVRRAGNPPGQVHVALDETPIGNYVELEGAQENIRSVATTLGFEESEFLRDSYYALYLKFCRQLNVQPGQMTFPAAGGSVPHEEKS
jgi:adenylate cyclase class 2